MAINERRRQQQLAKKAAERKKARQIYKKSHGRHTNLALLAANFPIADCFFTGTFSESGISNCLLTRRSPNGDTVTAAFLVDVFCLGVKNVKLYLLSPQELTEFMWQITGGHNDLQTIEPCCLRKLLDGAVSYARSLGFAPHPDYADVVKIFGDINAINCNTSYTYGRNGKPFYISGPNETPAQIRKILATLNRTQGANNYHYLTEISIDESKNQRYQSDKVILNKDENHNQKPLILAQTGDCDLPIDKLPHAKVRLIVNTCDDLLKDNPQCAMAIATLTLLLEEYPDVALLYDGLIIAYGLLGDMDNERRIVGEVEQRFTDHLFIRIAKAKICLARQELDKIPAIFGNVFNTDRRYRGHNNDVKKLEIIAFADVMTRYFLVLGDKTRVEAYYKVIKEVAPRHHVTKRLTKILYPGGILGRLRRFLWADT